MHYKHQRYQIVRWHNWRDRHKSEDRFAQLVMDRFALPAAAGAAESRGPLPEAGPLPLAPLLTVPPPALPPVRLVVAYGNGSGFHALRHSAPSPTTGLRR